MLNSIVWAVYIIRPVGKGGARGAHATPKEPKVPPDGIVKDLKWYKNNVVMLGLKISMYFQQFEDLKFLFFFPAEHAPGPPKNPCRVSNRPELGGLSWSYSRIQNPDSTSVATRVAQFWRTALTSQRTKKYIFVIEIIIRVVIRLANRLTWISRGVPSCSHDE